MAICSWVRIHYRAPPGPARSEVHGMDGPLQRPLSAQRQHTGRVAQHGRRRESTSRSTARCSWDPSMGYGAPTGQGLRLKPIMRRTGDRGAGAHRCNDGVVALRRGGWGSSGSGSSSERWQCPRTCAKGGKRGESSCPPQPLQRKIEAASASSPERTGGRRRG
jgi:hypothetical protein